MSLAWVLPPLLIFAFAGFAFGAWRRARLWRRGRPAAVAVFAGLLALPRRYFVDLHRVVARDSFSGTMHLTTACGFLAAVLLLVPVQLLRLQNVFLAWLLLAALALLFIGTVFVGERRLLRAKGRSGQLSGGAWRRLPISLAVFSLAFAIATLPATDLVPERPLSWFVIAPLAVALIWSCAELFAGLAWGGPMKHALAGALHLAFHPRPERFGTNPVPMALAPLDLNADKLGVETPRDFAWNRLLGFDACVECGRCEAVCPAFAAGQPLNPKKLIQDLVVGFTGPGNDEDYAGQPHPGQEDEIRQGAPDLPITPDLIAADSLWACTTCGACTQECPMMIDPMDAVIDLRRFLTLERGQIPTAAANCLEALRATDNPGGKAQSARLDWAAGLQMRRFRDVGQAEILLWPGDAAFDPNRQRGLRALVRLLQAASVDFAVLGSEELDCGDLARRLGDEASFQDLARRNILTLGKYEFRQIVTPDPHALQMLRNEYPDFGGHYQVLHHSTFLSELVVKGELDLRPRPGPTLTYHDPCYLGRYNDEIQAPRALLQYVGRPVRELPLTRSKTRCCGAGGGAAICDVEGETRIAD